MIKTLFVNGCSWTEGHMLHFDPIVHDITVQQGYEIKGPLTVLKDNREIFYPYRDIYNQHIWANAIASELNIPNITNYAVGAGSNDRILRTTVDYIKQLTSQEKQETFVVIGWTIPERSELFLDDKQGIAEWCVWNPTQTFSDVTRIHNPEYAARIDKFWEKYVVDVYNHRASIHKFFQQSYLLANLLKQQNIKYYFFNTFPVLFGLHNIDTVKEYFEYFHRDIEIYNNEIVSMPMNIDFFNFVGDNKELHLPDKHPNKLAHTMWGNRLLEDMKQQGII
jgi:hypothetical protein